MAVYERRYDPYTGERTALSARPWVITRFAWADISRSRLFLASLVACAFFPFMGLLAIYLHHNTQALSTLNINLADVVKIDGGFFYLLLWPQHWLALWMALVAGPGLVTRDMGGGALPLYLSRPISPRAYVFGKAMALFLLLSAITWVPLMLLWAFQATLDGGEWVSAHPDIPVAIVGSSVAWIALLTCLSLAISAWVRWLPVARLFLLAIVSVPTAFAMAIKGLTDMDWGLVMAPMQLVGDLRVGLMANSLPPWVVSMRSGFPSLPVAWELAAMALWCMVSLAALRLRIRAQEVVR